MQVAKSRQSREVAGSSGGERSQFRPLLGERGLLPVPRFVERVPARTSPSQFRWRYSDRLLGGYRSITGASA